MLQPVMSGCDLNFESLTLSVSWKESFACCESVHSTQVGFAGDAGAGLGKDAYSPSPASGCSSLSLQPCPDKVQPMGFGEGNEGWGGDLLDTYVWTECCSWGAFLLYLTPWAGCLCSPT